MRLGVAVEVARTTLREVLRACGVPFHLLMHGVTRRRWIERASDALAADVARVSELGRDEFVRRHVRAGAASRPRRAHVFISAGEASGEAHAANLVRAVDAACAASAESTAPRWSAFGGETLRAAGASVHYPLSEHAVMGIAGVLRSLPFVIGAFRRFVEMLRDDRPDLVVLVDYPGLHLVMARAARVRGIPVLHYVAPQYWGWGPWRMGRYRRAVDATLTILPFEAAFYALEGLASAYIGHPLLDVLATSQGGAPSDRDPRPILCIMPGSRRQELRLHLAPMVAIAHAMRARHPDLRIVLPHRDPKRVELLRGELAIVDPQRMIELEFGDPAHWLRRARAALVKSGTGSLEATLCGAPTVIVYVLHGLFTRWGYHHLLNVPWFGAANLIANRSVVPEFAIGKPTDWDDAARALESLLHEGEARDAALAGAHDVRVRLGEPGASARAATWVTPFCSVAGAKEP